VWHDFCNAYKFWINSLEYKLIINLIYVHTCNIWFLCRPNLVYDISSNDIKLMIIIFWNFNVHSFFSCDSLIFIKNYVKNYITHNFYL